jgi:excisionase family DNA binding protein
VPDPTPLLEVAAVAQRLGVSDDQVRLLIARGLLVATDVSTGSKRAAWRIHPDDLDEFLDSRRSQPLVPTPRQARRVGERVYFR